MIDKETIKNQLLQNSLNAGYSDIEFLINSIYKVENKKFKIKGKEDFLFYVDKEGEIINMIYDYLGDIGITDAIDEDKKPLKINLLIEGLFNIIVNRINEIYDLNLEIGEDYEIFINALDSHLSLKDEDFTETLKDKEQQTKNEIKAIIEHFN